MWWEEINIDKSCSYEETLELAVKQRWTTRHVFVFMLVHWNICKDSLGSVFRDKCWTQECTNGDVHNPFKSQFNTHPNTWAVTQHFLNHELKWDNFPLCFPNDTFQLKGAISDFHHFQIKGNKIAMWNSGGVISSGGERVTWHALSVCRFPAFSILLFSKPVRSRWISASSRPLELLPHHPYK